jgi:hypothetical protein
VVSSDKIAPWEILLLEESWAKGHRIGTIFKKFFMKTLLKSKINLIRKTLNFVSIQ